MGEKLPILSVRLFGREEITYGNRPILSGRSSATKIMKLWLILLYHGGEGITKNRLLAELYGREDVLDAANSLRVNIHRLKQFLQKEGLPEYNYIVSEKGVYYWRSPMVTETDTARFRACLKQADEAPDPASRCRLLQEACEIAGAGIFLQNLSGEEWVIIEGVEYQNLYEDALSELCAYLIGQKEYEEALRLVEPACEMYPLNEWQTVKMECYIGMGRYKDAFREYDALAGLLSEELGIGPSERMLELFEDMNQHMVGKLQMIIELKDIFHEENASEGALYCNLSSFRNELRLIRRMMERNGQSNYLMLISITDGGGCRIASEKKLNEMSQALSDAICRCLRKCDSYTKYNASQFLVLLIGINKENCRIVFERIEREFSSVHKSWGRYLENSVVSVADAKL